MPKRRAVRYRASRLLRCHARSPDAVLPESGRHWGLSSAWQGSLSWPEPWSLARTKSQRRGLRSSHPLSPSPWLSERLPCGGSGEPGANCSHCADTACLRVVHLRGISPANSASTSRVESGRWSADPRWQHVAGSTDQSHTRLRLCRWQRPTPLRHLWAVSLRSCPGHIPRLAAQSLQSRSLRS